MGDMDDGPEQTPLPDEEVENQVLALLPVQHHDYSYHASPPRGIYPAPPPRRSKQRRDPAVATRPDHGRLSFWAFAYEDGLKSYFPKLFLKQLFIMCWIKISGNGNTR